MPCTPIARAAVAAALLSMASGAFAGPCSPVIPAPCVNSYQGITLTSSLYETGNMVGLRYEGDLFAVDLALYVDWLNDQGSRLFYGDNMLGLFNSQRTWSFEAPGVVVPQIHVALKNGTADFGDPPDYQHPGDCPGGRCTAKYYDWDPNAPGVPPPASPARAGQASAAAAAAGPQESRAMAQNVVHDALDPTVVRYVDVLRFTSRAEVVDAAGSVWRYTYGFENLSDQALDYGDALLGFAGSVAAHGSASVERLSAQAPVVVTTFAEVSRNGKLSAGGRFDALAPAATVPEPSPAMLLLAGLACGAGLRRRRAAAAHAAVH